MKLPLFLLVISSALQVQQDSNKHPPSSADRVSSLQQQRASRPQLVQASVELSGEEQALLAEERSGRRRTVSGSLRQSATF